MKHADAACTMRRRAAATCISVRAAMSAFRTRERLEHRETACAATLARHEFVLHYQPKVDDVQVQRQCRGADSLAAPTRGRRTQLDSYRSPEESGSSSRPEMGAGGSMRQAYRWRTAGYSDARGCERPLSNFDRRNSGGFPSGTEEARGGEPRYLEIEESLKARGCRMRSSQSRLCGKQ